MWHLNKIIHYYNYCEIFVSVFRCKDYFISIQLFSLFIFFRDILITSVNGEITFADFCAEIKDICKFDDEQPFTMKWLDEEGNEN